MTQQQNASNMRAQITSSSAFKGVYRDRGNRRWRAQIKISGHVYYLGLFPVEEDAAHAYDAAALTAWGEYAYLNFPQQGRADQRC